MRKNQIAIRDGQLLGGSLRQAGLEADAQVVEELVHRLETADAAVCLMHSDLGITRARANRALVEEGE